MSWKNALSCVETVTIVINIVSLSHIDSDSTTDALRSAKKYISVTGSEMERFLSDDVYSAANTSSAPQSKELTEWFLGHNESVCQSSAAVPSYTVMYTFSDLILTVSE